MGGFYYELVYVILNIFRTYTIYRFMRIFYETERRKGWLKWMGYGLYYLVITNSYLLNRVPVFMLVINLVSLFALTLIYEAKLRTRIISTISIYLILVMVETLVVLLTGYIDLTLFEQSTFSSIYGMTAIQISSFLAAVICENCSNIKRGGVLPYSYWVALIILPVTTLYIVLHVLQASALSDYIIMSIIVLLLLCNICVFYLYDMIADQERIRTESIILEQQVESTNKQLEMLQTSLDNIKEVRHDLKNHLLSLKLMAGQDNRSEVNEYIDSILQQTTKEESYVHTGNVTADGILNLKIIEARKYCIKTMLDIQIPQNLQITAYDWTVILGNLLDNAIEANMKVEEEKRMLNITMCYKLGSLHINIQNTFSGAIEYKHKQVLKTTKTDKSLHGLGLGNIKRIIKRYQGQMMIDHSGNKFAVDIILFL